MWDSGPGGWAVGRAGVVQLVDVSFVSWFAVVVGGGDCAVD